MMKKIGAALLGLFLIAVSAIPAGAQFAVQATAIQSVAGTNTITGTLPNVVSYADVLNVLVKLTPAPATGNTTAATLNLNSIGPIAINKPTLSGLVALTGTELVAGQPAILMYNGTVFVLLSVTSTTVAASNLANSSLGFSVPVNLQLNASVGSNQLTIAVKGNNGSDPSATNPVLFSFRDTTIANGDPVMVSLQAPLSFTIGSGNTMGCVSAQMCRLWIEAINNAGTVALCAFNALSGTNIDGPIDEGVLQTSQSGTSGGSSAQLLYCSTTAVTNKAFRIIGYVEIQEGTAGTWATGPTFVQLFGPGIKKPGDVVKEVNFAGGTSTTPSQAITPSSAANIIKFNAMYNCTLSVSSPSSANFALRRSSTVLDTMAAGGIAGAEGLNVVASETLFDNPNTTSSTTYSILNSGATCAGVVTSHITLEEIQSMLEPANDNMLIDQPLRMVG